MPPLTIAAIIAGSLLYGYEVLRREVRHDFILWLAGRYYEIKHGKGWRRRAWKNLPTIAGLTIALQPSGYNLIWAPLVSTGWIMFTWWLLFDGWFNNIRRFNWWYVGTDDPEDARTDDLIQGLRRWQHKLVKIGTVVLFTTLYILLLIL